MVVVEVTEDMGVEAVVSAQMVVPSSPTVSFLRRLLTTQGNMLLLPLRLITGEWPLLHLRPGRGRGRCDRLLAPLTARLCCHGNAGCYARHALAATHQQAAQLV